MLGCHVLMLFALTEGAMDAAVTFMCVSFVFMILTSWVMSSTYLNWKQRKGYEFN